jgi:hypothetical protein
MTIRNAATIGASVGGGIAVVMIALDQLGLFSIAVNDFIDRSIFKVCPFYILGFSGHVKNEPTWFLVTIIGNAILYGLVFGAIAGIVSLFKRSAAI